MPTASARSHHGEALAYDLRGQGPPLVLLHPLGGDRRVWDPVLEPLSAARTVIAVDLPGFGESPPLAEAPTPAALARAVARFLAELDLNLDLDLDLDLNLDLDRPHVAGNSLGGWVALELALAGRARSVTAIAPAGLWGAPLAPKFSVARILARAVSPVVPLLAARPRGRRALLGGVTAHPDRVPPRAAAHLVRAYAKAPAFVAANDAMRAEFFDGLGRIEVPMTFGWPDHDRLVSRPARLEDHPGRIHSRVLVDCGHLPMWDAPDQVTRLLLDGSSA